MKPVISLNDCLVNVSKSECIVLGVCLSYFLSLIFDILYDIWNFIFKRLKNDK